MKNRVIIGVMLCVFMATSIFACGKADDTSTEVLNNTEVATNSEGFESDTATTETQEIEASSENISVDIPDGMAISPLTGLFVDEELAKQRPVSIMIENTQACLPQYNIGRADIIYEIPAEASITRYMGVFLDYSGMDIVGNVRSCRHYFTHFAHEYDSIYVHAGASPRARKTVLANGYIDNMDGTMGKAGAEYFRDDRDGRKAPHNLYISSEGIEKNIAKYEYRTLLNDDFVSPLKFAVPGTEISLENGSPAEVISLYFKSAKPYFVYNSEDGLYYRYEYGGKNIDAITGEQLAVKNIITLNMDTEITDEKGRRQIYTYGEGTGLYLTNGKCIDIKWSRETIYDVTHYYDMEGNELVINPGKTWFEICESDYAGNNKIYQTKEEFN